MVPLTHLQPSSSPKRCGLHFQLLSIAPDQQSNHVHDVAESGELFHHLGQMQSGSNDRGGDSSLNMKKKNPGFSTLSETALVTDLDYIVPSPTIKSSHR